MDARLSGVDRATLLVWRAFNLVGWTGLGVFIALNVHWMAVQVFGFSQTAGFHRAGGFAPELGAAETLRLMAIRIIITVLVSVAIGGITGARAYRLKTQLAAIGGLVYVLITLIGLEHNQAASADIVFSLSQDRHAWAVPNGFWRMLLHDLAIAGAIPLSARFARDSHGARVANNAPRLGAREG